MPEPRTVASDEQLRLGIATVIFDEKFVQPLNWRYERGSSGSPSLYFVTGFTTSGCGSVDAPMWCGAAPSATDPIPATSCRYAYSIAARPRLEWFSVPSASCT